jgi:ATPase family associated with various cellular activities (AAA)
MTKVVTSAMLLAAQAEVKSLAQEPVKKVLTETDDEIMTRLANRFEILEDMTRAVKKGDVRAMIVTGPPGVGKSFGVEKVLSKHDVMANIANDSKLKKYEVVKGAMSAIGLYSKLYEYSDKKSILVFDDCDSVLLDDLSLNILKAALDRRCAQLIRVQGWCHIHYQYQVRSHPFKEAEGSLGSTRVTLPLLGSKH